MNNAMTQQHRPRRVTLLALCAVLLTAFASTAPAQVRIINGRPVFDGPGGMPPGMDSSPSSSSSSKSDSSGKDAGGPWLPSEVASTSVTSTNADGAKTNLTEDIQLSFQGANIDMIVQWLAQQTGKTVVKHPRVQCQLTITSSKKVPPRQAIVLVYRALALEGFTAIESAQSIMIVPEGQEPRMSPELVIGSVTNIPAGRQKLVKVYSLKNVQATDLKDRIRIALTDKATIDIDERANQIIITDYNDNLRVAGELIEALDTDKPEDVAVRVMPLKNVSASQLAKSIGPLYQKMSGKSLDITADERANALIVLSSATAFQAIQKLVASLDTEDALEKSSETFILKNADAADVAKQLTDLNQSSTIQTRYFYNYGMGGDSSNQRKVSVVADRRRNAVIVQAPPAQMESVRKMIAELDAPVEDNSLAPKIYQLKYVSAVDIEDVLNELFLKKQPQRSYYDFFNPDFGQSSSDPDVGRLYGKVRITSEPHANTLIITSNSKENLAVVEDVLNQLDRPSDAGESTMRIGLKFAKASTVANSLNILFAKNGSPGIRPSTQPNPGSGSTYPNNPQQQQQSATSSTGFNLEQQTKEDGYYPWLGGQPDNDRAGTGKSSARAVSDLVGRVRTVADERGNSILISANVHYFPQILKLINDLDAASDQVSIEARIVEVSADKLDKLGVRWSPDGSQVYSADDYDNSFLIHGSGNYQKGFGGKTSVNSPSDSTAAQAITSLRSGHVSGSMNMDLLIQFLKKNTDASVIGSPQITINDNETGKLFVGQQVPVPDNNQQYQGTQNTSIKYKDVGVVLEVTPHINNNGDVQLKIHTESSTVVPGQTVLGGAVFDTRNFRTDLTSRNGQTLVLGGIIQRQMSDIQRRTPILGYIPVIEWAFKKKDKSQRQVELMVFLRTKVVRNAEESEELLRDVDKKAPSLKKWQDDNLPKAK
jgi:type II secretion system protein D